MEDRKDSIRSVLYRNGITEYNLEVVPNDFRIEQIKLDSIYQRGLTNFQKLLGLDSDSLTAITLKEICFNYKFKESARTQEERDSIIELYSLRRYQDANPYSYSSFLFELDNLSPEYDSIGAPLVYWKTQKDFKKKRFLENEVYKLWYRTYPQNYDIESWKEDQRDSLRSWNEMIRNFGVYLMGWSVDLPEISDEIIHWKLDNYLFEKGKRELQELEIKFREEGDKKAYRELQLIYMESVLDDLELELYAAYNFHWCESYLNAFSLQYDGDFQELPLQEKDKLIKILEDCSEHDCQECQDMLKQIELSGDPYGE